MRAIIQSVCVCVSWLCRAAFIVGSPDLMITLCPAALMTWEQRPKRWRQSTCWYESMSLLSWGRDQVQRRYDIWQIRQKVLNWPTFLCFTHIEAQPHPKTPTNKHWPSPTKCRGKMLVASAYCQKLPNISKNYQELQKDAKGAKSYQKWTKKCKKCQSLAENVRYHKNCQMDPKVARRLLKVNKDCQKFAKVAILKTCDLW